MSLCAVRYSLGSQGRNSLKHTLTTASSTVAVLFLKISFTRALIYSIQVTFYSTAHANECIGCYLLGPVSKYDPKQGFYPLGSVNIPYVNILDIIQELYLMFSVKAQKYILHMYYS